uniref:Mitochondrial sodium/hydrogen exchanger 9B2 n=1 Tax=Lygus hesperus TaxID=30085 RepID=A0A0A9X1M8_LYGHE
MIFSAGEGVSTTIINGVVDLFGGILAGLTWALVSSLLPNQTDIAVVSKRSAMLGFGGVSLVLGTSALNHSVIGSMGSITASLFANIAWCAQEPSNLKHNPVANVLSVVWRYTEPMLFAMVGAEIDIRAIPPSMIVYGIAILAVGLVGRVLVCYLALFGAGLNMRETIFVVLAWLPKATVQAAISAQALDIVRARKDVVASQDQLELAKWILNTAILSIVITAPIGSIAINVLGSRLLNKTI